MKQIAAYFRIFHPRWYGMTDTELREIIKQGPQQERAYIARSILALRVMGAA